MIEATFYAEEAGERDHGLEATIWTKTNAARVLLSLESTNAADYFGQGVAWWIDTLTRQLLEAFAKRGFAVPAQPEEAQ